MHFSDILSLCMSILGLYGLIYCLRFLIPRYSLRLVAVALDDTEGLLDRAELIGVIPRSNDYRTTLAIYGNQFLQMRTKSHRAPGILQQLRLAIWHGLTYKLYALSSRVEATKIKIELAVDERRLTSFSTTQSAVDMGLTCDEVESIAAMVMTSIVERISQWRRQPLLPRCPEPVKLSPDHVFYSPDLITSHFA